MTSDAQWMNFRRRRNRIDTAKSMEAIRIQLTPQVIQADDR